MGVNGLEHKQHANGKVQTNATMRQAQWLQAAKLNWAADVVYFGYKPVCVCREVKCTVRQ